VSEDGDWAEVAKVVDERLEELGLSQKGLAKRAGLSPATVRAVQRNYGKHRHKPGTLAALSGALELPPNYLENILDGRSQPERDKAAPQFSLDILMRRLDKLDKIDTMEERLNSIASDINNINKKLDRIVVDIQYPDLDQ
jgi:transcriptional regulator with XRE-family HTH domain